MQMLFFIIACFCLPILYARKYKHTLILGEKLNAPKMNNIQFVELEICCLLTVCAVCLCVSPVCIDSSEEQ